MKTTKMVAFMGEENEASAKCALIIPYSSVRHAQNSHSDSLNFCYDRKTTFMEEVYCAISNVKHIPKDASKCLFYWVIKNVCNSKVIMSAAAHNEASPQEMSYFFIFGKKLWSFFFAGVRKIWRVERWWEENFFQNYFVNNCWKKSVKTTKRKLSNSWWPFSSIDIIWWPEKWKISNLLKIHPLSSRHLILFDGLCCPMTRKNTQKQIDKFVEKWSKEILIELKLFTHRNTIFEADTRPGFLRGPFIGPTFALFFLCDSAWSALEIFFH